MFKRRFIFTSSCLFLIIIMSIVDNYTGFDKGYFAISSAIILSGYWIFEFLLDLILYYMDYEDDFKIFIAEKVNKTALTYEEIMAKEKFYFKEFKRTRIKGKMAHFAKLFFTMGLFIFLVVCLF